MDNYSTPSFLQAFARFACQVGYPKFLLPDEGSQLLKACESMKLNFYNTRHQLHTDHHVTFQVCPVGGHHIHGKVERKIRGSKSPWRMLWETLVAEITNSINDLPLALGNVVGELLYNY